MTKVLRIINLICFILVIIGSINWLLIGLFDWNLVGAIFAGDRTIGSRIVYSIVGFASLYLLVYPIVNKGHIELRP